MIADKLLGVTEPVGREFIAGARNEPREHDLRRLLQRFKLLSFDAAVDFEGAARIYRRSRRAGVTPRGIAECRIASLALRHGAPLLTADADLGRVDNIVEIDLDAASIAPR
jgi:predicted nucleic acid-binding protein